MKKRRTGRAGRLRTTVSPAKPPRRPSPARPPRRAVPPAPRGSAPPFRAPARQVARLIDLSDRSLADVIDSLLNKGVVLNADLILGLANVDLIYIRLSALLCAADRLAAGEDRR